MNVDLLRAPQFRAARAMLNLTREDLATRAGTSVSAVAKAEDDPTIVNATSLERIVGAFGRSGIYFVKDAGRIGVLLRQ